MRIYNSFEKYYRNTAGQGYLPVNAVGHMGRSLCNCAREIETDRKSEIYRVRSGGDAVKYQIYTTGKCALGDIKMRVWSAHGTCLLSRYMQCI